MQVCKVILQTIQMLVKILMLYVYLKNERDNLTEEQKRLMKQIAEEYKHE
jgi:hypothetical protein